MPASGVPPTAYIGTPENEGSLVGALRIGNPRAIGALRLDIASPDPAYRNGVREAFYGDVDPALADAAVALLAPDAPARITTGRPRSPRTAGARSRALMWCARRT